MKKLIAGLWFVALASVGHSQVLHAVGLDIQVYPSGFIAAGNATFEVHDNWIAALYAGYNIAERQDFGEHDDESGGGPGFGGMVRYFFETIDAGWFSGARFDVWFLEIDWEDNRNGKREAGSSDITVLQPTMQVGYAWLIKEYLSLETHASLGAEVNVSTDGEEVGEGAIILLGMTLHKKF